LSNLLFVQAAVETLPAELQGVANEVYINFPWGSLLRAVGLGEALVLRDLRRICSPNARLKVFVGLDSERDRAEIERLALPVLSTDYVSAVLAPKYREADFEIVEIESLPSSSLPEMHTSWARRLQRSSRRSFLRIVAQTIEEE
jgi:16S rRNA (adenine(1408)-N(1))-methyltransferase